MILPVSERFCKSFILHFGLLFFCLFVDFSLLHIFLHPICLLFLLSTLLLHAAAHTSRCSVPGLYEIVVTAHLSVCARIKPTSILRGSRGNKAPLQPLGMRAPSLTHTHAHTPRHPLSFPVVIVWNMAELLSQSYI